MTAVILPGLKDSDGVVFKTIPAGQYPARITKIETKTTSENAKKYKGVPYWNFTARVIEGNEGEGSQHFFMAMLPAEEMDKSDQQRNVDQIKHYAIAAGLDIENDELDSQDFIGQEVLLVITEKTVEGVKKNEVKEVLPIQD